MIVIVKYIYIAVFAVLISVIGIATILKFNSLDSNSSSNIENRESAVLPAWKWESKSIKKYFSKLDSYINDDFSFRTELINYYSFIHFKIGISIKPEKVVIGKNDFLFLGNFWEKVIDQTTGKNIFLDHELQTWNNNFLQRKNYLNNLEIPLYVVIAPNKHSIYPEYLPNYIKLSENNRLQQILESKPDFNIINTKDILLKSKGEYDNLLYYKTDSHWSVIGAYLAYAEIMQCLAFDFTDLKPIYLDKNNFKIKEHDHGWGNLHQLNIASSSKDFRVQIIKNNDWADDLTKTNFDGDTLPFNSLQHIIYNEQVIVYNKHKPYTVLLLKDSFSESLSIYLNQTFGKIIYCHYNQAEGIELTELIDKYNPDIVLYEFIERSLSSSSKIHPNILIKSKQVNFKPIQKIDGEYLFNHVKSGHKITDLRIEENTFSFYSLGNDPIFIIPKTDVPSDKNILIKINYKVPAATSACIYYVTGNNKNHNEKQSVRLNANKGRNILTFYLSEKDINGELLRFDPGSTSGKYFINSIETFEVE